jgi:hypothetical protein
MKMKDIQRRELIRAIDLIKALGCAYKVITPDGEEFGDLQVIDPSGTKRGPRKYPYGVVVSHVRKYLDMDAAIGVVQEVPCGEFDVEALRASVCNLLTRVWGTDTYTTATQSGKVEVMRTAVEAV